VVRGPVRRVADPGRHRPFDSRPSRFRVPFGIVPDVVRATSS
jgi:hypothetical protein